MNKTIMISAGEASGDLHAANMIRALQQLDPDLKFTGMGASKMHKAGAELLVDCTDIAVMGIVEVLLKYRQIMKALNILRDAIKQNPPDLLVLVDYQEFNFKLAQTAKACGVKVLFYISPQVWAWRPHRVKKMGERIDMMAVLFPFEEKFYKNANVPVRFVGNPLVDQAQSSLTRVEALEHFQLQQDRRTIGLFPGSRKTEIQRLLPTLLQASRLLYRKHNDLQFILPVASTLGIDEVEPYLADFDDISIKLVQDNPYDVMQACDAIMTASGTATLEIALLGIPNVITYRISPISYFILKRLVSIRHIGLVNIVAEKEIVKEFIQHEATPQNLYTEIDRLLTDQNYRENMIRELNQVKALLGKEGGSQNIARLAMEMLAD
ncbi:MAG: lipid-A-disaccharide synthase [Gammaproteobacteria bacterium]|nr:lipid-A-disaccharide synthase [Gammaproteobacteria bacterium]